MQVWNVLQAARWKYRTQKWCKKSPSEHHRTTLSGYIFATKACIDNQKNLLRSNISSRCPYNMVNFGPLTAESKLLLQRFNRSFTRYAIGLGKQDFRILVGLLTGHNWLNRHMSVMGLRENPKCPLCDEEDETSLHLLSKCPATMLCRNALLAAYQLSPLDLRGIHWAGLTYWCLQKLQEDSNLWVRMGLRNGPGYVASAQAPTP